MVRRSPRPRACPGGGANRASRFIIPVVVLVFVLGGVGAWFFFFRGPTARADLIKAKVERVKVLQFKVVERGFLEAKNNNNIVCDVKTGNRGAPKIKTVVDNGTPVKKGELLMQIDDSYLKDQLVDQQIARDKAEQDMIAAEKAYPGLQAAITVAEKNLTKWKEGDFPQQLNDLEGKIENAKATLSQQEDRTDWTAHMVKKTYMTASQLQSEEANLQGDKYALDQLLLQKKVLQDYTNVVQTLTLTTAVASAKDSEARRLRQHAVDEAHLQAEPGEVRGPGDADQAVRDQGTQFGHPGLLRARAGDAQASARTSRSSPRASRCSTARR